MLNEMLIDESHLTWAEKKILQVRKGGIVSFGELVGDNLKWALDKIIISGAAISGCALPQTDFFAESISEQIKGIIVLSFSHLPMEEIILAMQLNSLGTIPGEESNRIEFYGNTFNCVYLSKILTAYSAVRYSLDRKIQNQIDGY